MKKIFAVAYVVFACFASSLHAGDGVPFYPKRLTVEFDSPIKNDPKIKYNAAKLIMEFGSSADGNRSWEIRYSNLTNLVIEVGKERLTVPKEILSDINHILLLDISFDWWGGNYALHFNGTIGQEDNFGDIYFTWKDGKLIGIRGGKGDMTSRYSQYIK